MNTAKTTMRLFALIFALSATVRAGAATVNVFLTGGQSNTEGRIPNSQLPDYLKSNEYALVCEQHTVNEATLGQFSAFAPTDKWAYDAEVYYRIGQALETQFYVAKTSYGGTSINPAVNNSPSGHDNAWLPGYGGGYHWSANETFLNATVSAGRTFVQDETTYDGQSMLKAWIENIDAAIDAIIANGDTPVVKAIIWHQGESDNNSGSYAEDLTAVVTYVRNHLTTKLGVDCSALPFFCGNVPRKSSLFKAGLDRAFQTIEDTEGNHMHVVDIYDLTMLSDNKHFDAPSAILFGQRLYNRMVDEGVISGTKVDVDYCVRSPDFGTEHVVNNTTTWLWDDASGDLATSLTNLDGIYFHAGSLDSRKVQVYSKMGSKSLDWTIGDTTPTTVSKGAYCTAYGDNGGNLSTTSTAGENNKASYMVAVNVGRAGSFEVFYWARESSSAKLYLNGKVVDTQTPADGELVSLKGANTGKAVYYIALGKGAIMGARFVPDEEMPAVSVTLDESGWGTLGNLYESNFTLPEGLKAYTVSPYAENSTLLSLTEVSSVNIGEAVVVRGEAGTYNFTPGEGTAHSGENLLVVQETTGVLESTSGSDFFNFAQGVNENGKLIFTRADGTETLEAGKAFFSITEGDAHALEPTLRAITPGGDSAFSWTCNFGDKYESQVSEYLSLASLATDTKTTGTSGTKKDKTYLVLSDSSNSGVKGGITSTFNFPNTVKLADNGYTMEFDYAPSYGQNSDDPTIYGLVVYDSIGNALFNLYGKPGNGGIDVCLGSGTDTVLGSIAASALQRYDASATSANWLHITIVGSVDDDNITITINKSSDNEDVELSSSEVLETYATLGKITVRTANRSVRRQWAGLDDFNFEGYALPGITEWTSGEITESIKFGKSLETDGAVSITGGTALAPIVFSTDDDLPLYGLTITGSANMSIGDTAAKGSDAHFTVESGSYAVGGNLLVGKQSYTKDGDWSQDYITMNDGSVNIAGNMIYPHGTMNMNGGAWTVGGTLNLANQNRASATINVNGGKLSADQIHVAPYAGDGPTINLSGGTLEVGYFSRQHASYTSMVYFQGGTLKAQSNANTFAPAGISFVVNEEGGTIDVNRQNITVANAITGMGTLTVTGGGKLTLSSACGGTGSLSLDVGTVLDLGGNTSTFASATIGGVVTNGTLAVTGLAKFTAGAVIDIGNTTVEDGAVVMTCGSVDGLENLSITANGTPVAFRTKLNGSGELVLWAKSYDFTVEGTDISIAENFEFDNWLRSNDYDVYTADGITAMESALVTKNETTHMSPLEAYLLGYDDKDAVPNLQTVHSGNTVTFGFDAESGERSLSGLRVSYKLYVSDDDPKCKSAEGAIVGNSLTIDESTKTYTRLVAEITAE